MVKKRILTGDMPTGKLHLGHYVGTLENRVKLQEEYETFIILANVHSYTTNYKDPEKIRQDTLDVALDNLAVGLDPKKVSLFLESEVPEILELHTYFEMLVRHSRALRNPTVKDEILSKQLGKHVSLGFISYPILQAADILAFRAHLVPVGEDQIPHLEQTREIAREFNKVYGEVFPIPEPLVGKIGRLPGTDGQEKMGKSLGNAIFLSDPPEVVKEKVMGMYTDPKRIHPDIPGTVEGNPVFIYHDAFNENKAEVEDLKNRYRTGKVGDVEVKEKLISALNKFLDPIRQRRMRFESQPDLVEKIIKE
ncbi:MAG: tryptophan--tRNA ligase, partial [Candidatus Cloacimonetes bacterium]|nr:tryptophan--tRNA ligase [Candidatus Cloacimonadota bacterium]